MCFDEGILMAYVEGEMTPHEQQRVAEHLNSCPRCRRTVAELRTLTELVDRGLTAYSAGVAAVKPDQQAAWVDLYKHLAQAKPSWFQRPWVSIMAMAAAVCLIFGIGFGLQKMDTTHNTPPLIADEAGEADLPLGSSTAPSAPTGNSCEGDSKETKIAASVSPDITAGAVTSPSETHEVSADDSAATSVRIGTPTTPDTTLKQATRGSDGHTVKMNVLTLPALTIYAASSGKFVKDGEGVRLLTDKELEQVISWLASARQETPSDEPPPTEELRIDLNNGGQISIGLPENQTVLVAGLHGPGTVRLISPELATFLTLFACDSHVVNTDELDTQPTPQVLASDAQDTLSPEKPLN